jgi:branched-subunit amino acid transport protein
MSEATLWLTIFIGGVLTYAIRLSLILAWGRVALPPALRRGLRFVPPAVLSAIIFPALLRPQGPLDLSLQNARLLAGVTAVLVAWRTRSALLTIAAGIATLWGWQAILSR